MLEKEFESKMTDIVKSVGGLCLKFESPGNTGVPDRLVIGTHGNIYFVEMKRPSQSRTAAKQNYWKDKLTKHGCKSFIIHNEEELDKFLRLLKIDERQDPSLRHYICIACKRKDLHGKEIIGSCFGQVAEMTPDYIIIDFVGERTKYLKG